MASSKVYWVIGAVIVAVIAAYYYFFIYAPAHMIGKALESAGKAIATTAAAAGAKHTKAKGMSSGCNSVQKLAQDYDILAMDANATQPDVDNYATGASERTVAGAMLRAGKKQAYDRALDHKYGISNPLHEHETNKRVYGCGEDELSPATCFDTGSMMHSELKRAIDSQ